MANRVLSQLRMALSGTGSGLTDGQLLAQFVATRDEAAFTTLVRRHGPMVLNVCRRVLHHTQDAEDAFQAAFVVLARKALSLSPREGIVGWLHGVAYRAALEMRSMNARKRAKERSLDDLPDPAECQPVREEELTRLLGGDCRVGRSGGFFPSPATSRCPKLWTLGSDRSSCQVPNTRYAMRRRCA